jgi:hypothetical protein
MEGKGRVPPKPKPHDKEVIRRVEKARPGAKATEPTFDAIIDAILDAKPENVRKIEKRPQHKTNNNNGS